MTAAINPWPACPTCGHDLADADAALGPGVAAARDPEGKARVELLLTCYQCESEFCAFVAVGELTDVTEGA